VPYVVIDSIRSKTCSLHRSHTTMEMFYESILPKESLCSLLQSAALVLLLLFHQELRRLSVRAWNALFCSKTAAVAAPTTKTKHVKKVSFDASNTTNVLAVLQEDQASGIPLSTDLQRDNSMKVLVDEGEYFGERHPSLLVPQLASSASTETALLGHASSNNNSDNEEQELSLTDIFDKNQHPEAERKWASDNHLMRRVCSSQTQEDAESSMPWGDIVQAEASFSASSHESSTSLRSSVTANSVAVNAASNVSEKLRRKLLRQQQPVRVRTADAAAPPQNDTTSLTRSTSTQKSRPAAQTSNDNDLHNGSFHSQTTETTATKDEKLLQAQSSRSSKSMARKTAMMANSNIFAAAVTQPSASGGSTSSDTKKQPAAAAAAPSKKSHRRRSTFCQGDMQILQRLSHQSSNGLKYS